MRKFLKFVLIAGVVCFIGLPVTFVLFVMVMALLGITIGIGSAILALIFTVLKVALMIVLPIALIVWVAKRLMAPERTY
ncbi:MAG TPA: hypothetical protein VFI52_08600 [Gemmatimonadaceae bacterium]|nr:hypothetical protein [Gemmatimonadaceae bacterium]